MKNRESKYLRRSAHFILAAQSSGEFSAGRARHNQAMIPLSRRFLLWRSADDA
jgi:hypothetical protein